jgi:hypothetical protein
MVSGGGGTALGEEGEEALTSKGRVKTRGMINRLIKKEGATLTWGPGLSSDPRSGATAAVVVAAVVVAAVVVAAGAPGGDRPRVVVVED